MIEGLQGRKRRRGEGGKKGQGEGGEKLAQMSLKRVCVPASLVQRKTYLQRLNKTSLCQTIQGMAGHSLCGVEGWREVGSGERCEEEGGGRGMEGREVGERGKERRTVA